MRNSPICVVALRVSTNEIVSEFKLNSSVIAVQRGNVLELSESKWYFLLQI